MISVVDHKLTWQITPKLVADITERIRNAFNPERIVVFGSAARGETANGSDLDLLVVMESDLPPHKRATPIRLMFRPSPCPMDILVFTPREVAHWNGAVGHIVTEALRTGKVMYDKSQT